MTCRPPSLGAAAGTESGASVTEQAHLPWRKEFTASAGTKLGITVADTDGPSTVGDLVIPTKVSCQIIMDDSVANSSGLQADRASCDYTVA